MALGTPSIFQVLWVCFVEAGWAEVVAVECLGLLRFVCLVCKLHWFWDKYWSRTGGISLSRYLFQALWLSNSFTKGLWAVGY
jgi:hypothetical protein